MKSIFFLIVLMSCNSFSQKLPKTVPYKYGHNGMELIAESKKGTVIISTYHSKPAIKEDLAQKVYTAFLEQKITTGKLITIFGANAKVTGKCIVRKKDNLTLVDFYYQKIEWNSGLTEVSITI